MSFISDTTTPVISTASPGDFIALLKPRVMSLVVYTAIAGMLIAAPGLNFTLAVAALVAITVGAGASGALNMWYDADIDAVMRRTAKRPIPMGRITQSEALAFGLTLAALSVFTLGIVANWLAAGLLAFTIFFYIVVLFDVAEAHDAPKHRHRWRRRRLPADGRLCRRHGPPVMVVGRAVRADLRVDAAALLGARARQVGRIRQSRHSDAAQRRRPGPDPPRHPPLFAAARPRRHAALADGLCHDRLRPFCRAALGLAFVGLAWRVYRLRDGKPAETAAYTLFSFSILYLFLLFAEIIGERTLMIAGMIAWP